MTTKRMTKMTMISTRKIESSGLYSSDCFSAFPGHAFPVLSYFPLPLISSRNFRNVPRLVNRCVFFATGASINDKHYKHLLLITLFCKLRHIP